MHFNALIFVRKYIFIFQCELGPLSATVHVANQPLHMFYVAHIRLFKIQVNT